MIFGWDISTSIIGFTALDNSGSFVESRYCDIRKEKGSLIDKGDVTDWFIKEIAAEYGPKDSTAQPSYHFVEDKLGNFSGGRTSMQTLMKLAAFNAMVSWMIWDYYCLHHGGGLEHLHTMTIKAQAAKDGLVIPKGVKGQDKKLYTLKWVIEHEKSFPTHLNKNGNFQPYCFDMADSFVIARAGYRKFICKEK